MPHTTVSPDLMIILHQVHTRTQKCTYRTQKLEGITRHVYCLESSFYTQGTWRGMDTCAFLYVHTCNITGFFVLSNILLVLYIVVCLFHRLSYYSWRNRRRPRWSQISIAPASRRTMNESKSTTVYTTLLIEQQGFRLGAGSIPA